MSASRQKKLRKEQASAAPQTKRPAVSEEEKAAKRLKLWSIVFYIVIGLGVILGNAAMIPGAFGQILAFCPNFPCNFRQVMPYCFYA